MTRLDTLNTSYGQRKGQKSNWQIDSWPLKFGNHPNFLVCKWHETYHWKALDKGYNFALNLISIGGLHAKLWTPKVAGVPLGSPGTKWHLGVSPMANHKIYYKGEGDGFPQVWAMVSLVNPCLLVSRLCTKVLQLHTNQLVVWFVQVRVNDWNACQSSKFHPEALACPSALEMLQAKERAPTPSPFVVHLWISGWVHQRAWGCVIPTQH
jgi:hypothetical protein